MSLKGRDVTVLGAGVAGLAVAQAMAQRGAHVRLLEQADGLRDVGAGLQISPNGAAVLRALGLEPALEAASLRAKAVELRDGLSGRVVTRLEVGKLRPDQGYHFLHRADLIEILGQGARAAGVEINLLHRVDRVDLQGPVPCNHMVLGSKIESDLLIGADGLHSRLRNAIVGCKPPFFTGQVAWRAIVPAEADAPAVAEVHMGEGRHLVSYPLRGGLWRNIVAVEERNSWSEESWTQKGDPEELRHAFASFAPRVQDWLSRIETLWLWGLFRHPVAETWYKVLPQGAAVLLGDAAHPTLPFLAQGANMALEDAWVLADSLDRGLGDAEALARYQDLRRARSARIVEAANGNARAYHLRGPLRRFAHMGLRLGGALAPNLALGRFDWIYGHDVTAQSRAAGGNR